MANIAIFRINYKSDFILTLNSDAGWLTPFCIKFWTGAPSQAYFVGFDGTTYTHCATVAGEPTKLLVQFDDHHLPIGDLKFQIGYHFTVADFPTSVEDEVINQASVIIEVDGAPAKVMLDLNGETAPEIEFSLPAYANEAQRIENEQQRIENEQQRIDNEQQRIEDEQARQRNEEIRIENEQERVREFGQMKGDLEQATRDAAAAAENANEKAVYAKNQGDYAKQQGDTAKADHERAEDDHRIAGEDHTQAGTDHTRAGEDHTQAGSDHTRAGEDHTRAGEDHTRAESDHTRAESDHAAVEVYVDSLGAFDISAYHATGGVLAKYADLTAALGTNGANIPDVLRKGGMSVKFVQSSDNNYVQFRFMLSGSFTTAQFTNPANWQGVDEKPTKGSKNLIESGGVEEKLSEIINNSIFFEKLSDSLYIYQNQGLQSDGTLGALTNARTTDFIEIGSEKYIYTKAFPSGYQWCFFILYDADKEIIANFYNGEQVIDLSNYPAAKYFRCTTGNSGVYGETSISISPSEINNKINTNTQNISELDSELDNLSGIVDGHTDVLYGEATTEETELPFSDYTNVSKGLQSDGTLSPLTNFNTTDYVSLDDVVGLSGTMFPSGYNWCFLILFDANYNIVEHFYGETNINLANYPTAKYFRATRNSGTTYVLNVTKNVREGGVVQQVGELMSFKSVLDVNTSVYGLINDETATAVSGSQSDLIVSNENSYVQKEGYLKEITVESAGAGYMRFVVGSIDQRDWIIASKEFTLAVVNGVNVLDVHDKQIYLGQNEQLFVYANYDGNAKALYVTNSSNVAIQGEYGSEVEKVSTQNSLSIQLQYSVSEVSSVFAEKRELEQVKEMVHDNSVAIANNKFVEDSQGNKYRIAVVNGELVPEIVTFGKVVVLGNSLTCAFGENYPMAATTINTGWVKEIESLMLEVDANTNIHTINIAAWERDFTYDLDDFNIPTDADTILYKAGENVNNNPDKQNYLSALEALLTYVETRCPNAKIYVCGGFWAGNTTTTMAARALGLPHINSGDEGNYRMSVGDYVYGEENVLHPITDSAVAWHVGDYGFYLWTNRLANALGLSQLDSVHIIDVASDSRKIFITRNIGVAGGIISIHTFSNTAPTFLISTDSETIQYTNNDVASLNIMRDGVKTTFVTTFVMPNKDVQIIRV